MEYPDFLEVQLKSFQDFFQLDTPAESRKNEGLFKVFSENFPIEDTRNNFKLLFEDYFVDPPKYSIEECLRRGLTYSVPLRAKLKLTCEDPEHEDFESTVQDVFLGSIPYMTPAGTFVINGAERVVVSQHTALQASSLDPAYTTTGRDFTRLVSSHSRGLGLSSLLIRTTSYTLTSIVRRSSPSQRSYVPSAMRRTRTYSISLVSPRKFLSR